MLQNYLKIALRNLLRQKTFSFINMAGLATGLACSILILLWVQSELSFDRFHAHADELYRVVKNQYYTSDKKTPVAVTPGPLALTLKESFPEIKESTRFSFINSTLQYKESNFDEKGGCVDPSFFRMFSFFFIEGTPATALTQPHAIVITQSLAHKYFGNQNPIGKTLYLDNQYNFIVTGVLKDIPANSHLQFDFLVPFAFRKERGDNLETWENSAYYTYIQLQESASAPIISKKIAGLIKQFNKNSNAELYLQPLAKIHLYSDFTADVGGLGDIKYVYILATIAFFILLIACINFMNLATARSARRAKEVGIRKVVGANRSQLIVQFMGESFVISLLALSLAIIMVALLLPAFNGLSGKLLSLSSFSGEFILLLAGITLITILLSGSYPAFFLSAYEPVYVLKGIFQSQNAAGLFRKILVLGQFSLSILLIICTLIVYNQLDFIQHKQLGFNRDNIIYLPLKGKLKNNYRFVKNNLLQQPTIVSVTATNQIPTNVVSSTSDFNWEGKKVNEKVNLHFAFVDYDYLPTMGIKLTAGRYFSAKFATDSAKAVILNETAVKQMGLSNPVGKHIRSASGNQLTIVGVTKDFHFKSLHSPIEPLILAVYPQFFDYLLVKTRTDNIGLTIKALETTWKDFNPEYPFSYYFLDQDFENLYLTEQRVGKLLGVFAGLAVLISCLGLFGLAAFTAEQRTKEIGIRKVLGASVRLIVTLLSKDFLKLVLLANCIAWPLAWWAMHVWLQSFEYRISISWWIFALAGVAALFIALLTVGYQATKAALMNPVKALRNE